MLFQKCLLSLIRENFLFAGSECAGEHAASMYWLMGSFNLNEPDPEFYLRAGLPQIANHEVSRAQDLLPWKLAPSLQTPASMKVGL